MSRHVLILPDGTERAAPKTRGLWIWVELKDGQKFDAIYPGLDLLKFQFPVTVERLNVDRRTAFELRSEDVHGIAILQAIGCKPRKSLDTRTK